jgi:hypothetical protein
MPCTRILALRFGGGDQIALIHATTQTNTNTNKQKNDTHTHTHTHTHKRKT